MKHVCTFLMIAVLMTPAVGMAQPRPTPLAAQLVKRLDGLMSKEFGTKMTGEVVAENKVAVLHTIAVDYPFEPGTIESSWTEKVVQVLEKADAHNVRVTARTQSGSAEVRATNLPVGERTAAVVQVTSAPEDNLIGFSVSFMSKPPGKP